MYLFIALFITAILILSVRERSNRHLTISADNAVRINYSFLMHFETKLICNVTSRT